MNIIKLTWEVIDSGKEQVVIDFCAVFKTFSS